MPWQSLQVVGEFGGDVIRIGRCLKIRRVTGVAGRGHCLKLTSGCALVAGVAVDGGMRSGQREAVVVLLNLLDRNLPASNGVALFAVGSRVDAGECRRGSPDNADRRS